MDPASAFSFDMSYCGAPPSPADLFGRWNLEPMLLCGLALAGLLGWWLLRPSDGRRKAAYAGAWVVLAVLFVSPLCALTVSLFSARVGHHATLAMVVAPLLALALPARWGQRLPLLPALVLSTLALWLWHTPDIYASAFLSPALYWVMQSSILGSFTLLWLGLLRSESALGAGMTALSSAVQMGLLGALLVFAPAPLYLPHLATTSSFGLLALEDQQLGGLIMWVPANLPLLALVIWRLVGTLAPNAVRP